jgi:hypothetical protein
MRLKAVEEMPRRCAIIGVDLEPGIDERANEPSPHCALVIGCIAGTQVAEIVRPVIGSPGAKERNPTGVTGFTRTAVTTASQCFRSRTGCASAIAKILVRSETGIVTVVAVDDIVEITALLVPEAAIGTESSTPFSSSVESANYRFLSGGAVSARKSQAPVGDGMC